ncbi:MAG: hypothetical protein HQ579_05480, partial [Candidatus Omnitrophica bacterium]|nr:hypothetical protein [Candidatus Omnitrophota bacterium]
PLHIFVNLENKHGNPLIRKYGLMTGTMPRGIDKIWGTNTKTFRPEEKDIRYSSTRLKEVHRPVLSSTKERKRNLYTKEVVANLNEGNSSLVHCESENEVREAIFTLAAELGWDYNLSKARAVKDTEEREKILNAARKEASKYIKDNGVKVEEITIYGTEGNLDAIRDIVRNEAGKARTVTFLTNMGSRGQDYQLVAELLAGGEGFIGISTFFSPYLALFKQFSGRIGRPRFVEDEDGGHLEATSGILKAFWCAEDDALRQYWHLEQTGLNALERTVKNAERKGNIVELDDQGLGIKDERKAEKGRVIVRKNVLSQLYKKIEDSLIESSSHQKRIDNLLFKETTIEGVEGRKSIWTVYTEMLRNLSDDTYADTLFDHKKTLGKLLRSRTDEIAIAISKEATFEQKREVLKNALGKLGITVDEKLAVSIIYSEDISTSIENYLKKIVTEITKQQLLAAWGEFLLELENYKVRVRRVSWAQQASQVDPILTQATVTRNQFRDTLLSVNRGTAIFIISKLIGSEKEVAERIKQESGIQPKIEKALGGTYSIAWRVAILSAFTFVLWKLTRFTFGFFSFLAVLSGQSGPDGLGNLVNIFNYVPESITSISPETALFVAATLGILMVAFKPLLKSLQAKDTSSKDISAMLEKYETEEGMLKAGPKFLLNRIILSPVNMLAPLTTIMLILVSFVTAGAETNFMMLLGMLLPGVSNPLLTLALLSAIIGAISYLVTIAVNVSNLKKPHAEASKPFKEGLDTFVQAIATLILTAGIYKVLGASSLGLIGFGIVGTITIVHLWHFIGIRKKHIEFPHVVGALLAVTLFSALVEYLVPLYSASPTAVIIGGAIVGVIIAGAGIQQVIGQRKLYKETAPSLLKTPIKKTLFEKIQINVDYIFKTNLFTARGVVIGLTAGAGALGSIYGLMGTLSPTSLAIAALIILAIPAIIFKIMATPNSVSLAMEKMFRPKKIVQSTAILTATSIMFGHLSAGAAVASQVETDISVSEQDGISPKLLGAVSKEVEAALLQGPRKEEVDARGPPAVTKLAKGIVAEKEESKAEVPKQTDEKKATPAITPPITTEAAGAAPPPPKEPETTGVSPMLIPLVSTMTGMTPTQLANIPKDKKEHLMPESAGEISIEDLVPANLINSFEAGIIISGARTTAYCGCELCNGPKYAGLSALNNMPLQKGMIAVSSELEENLPLGSVVELPGLGRFVVADRISKSIKGKVVDIYVNEHKEAFEAIYNRKNLSLRSVPASKDLTIAQRANIVKQFLGPVKEEQIMLASASRVPAEALKSVKEEPIKPTITEERSLPVALEDILGISDTTARLNTLLHFVNEHPDKREEYQTALRPILNLTAFINNGGLLRYNSKVFDENVKIWQTMLVAMGYELPKHGIDGKCGTETINASNRFHDDNGLIRKKDLIGPEMLTMAMVKMLHDPKIAKEIGNKLVEPSVIEEAKKPIPTEPEAEREKDEEAGLEADRKAEETRLEAERKAAEEAERVKRLEIERRKAEEARIEAERQKQLIAERQEAERQARLAIEEVTPLEEYAAPTRLPLKLKVKPAPKAAEEAEDKGFFRTIWDGIAGFFIYIAGAIAGFFVGIWQYFFPLKPSKVPVTKPAKPSDVAVEPLVRKKGEPEITTPTGLFGPEGILAGVPGIIDRKLPEPDMEKITESVKKIAPISRDIAQLSPEQKELEALKQEILSLKEAIDKLWEKYIEEQNDDKKWKLFKEAKALENTIKAKVKSFDVKKRQLEGLGPKLEENEASKRYYL